MRYRKITDENPAPEKNGEKKGKLIRLLRLAASFVLLFAVYIVGIKLECKAVVYIYYALLFVSMIAFVILNRGFDSKSPLPEMLPDEWDDERKRIFIEKDKKLKSIARYLLYLIIPLLFIFGLDIIYMAFIS